MCNTETVGIANVYHKNPTSTNRNNYMQQEGP